MTFSGGQWNRDRAMPGDMPRRVRVLGAIAVLIFVVIIVRLWTLQVLSGDDYRAEAQDQRVRTIALEAPRGDILDRNGDTLVSNRMSLALQVRPELLPETRNRRERVLADVAELAGMGLEDVKRKIREEQEAVPGAPVTLVDDVGYDTVYYLRENEDRFPGVTIDRVFVRKYDQGTIAAQVLGYAREVSSEELADPRYQELEPGDQIGKDGIERTYDHLLRGVNGLTETHVDAAGLPTGTGGAIKQPITGNDLYLTIDSKLQQTGEDAVNSFYLPGAFAALDVKTGEVLALGSLPSYDPAVFSGEVDKATSVAVFGDPKSKSNVAAPAFNRAIAGGYPVGSTFKPVTGLAALDAGRVELNETIVDDDGVYKVGDVEFTNAGGAITGAQTLQTALQVSADVFFYTLGDRLQEEMDIDGKQWIQDWAQKLGFGDTTGIDLEGEAAGRVPTPEWRDEFNAIGAGDGRPWSSGDNINLSVGQGDLLASPLQLAVAYATLGNGGDVVTPHVGMRAVDQAGNVIQEIAPPPRRHVNINEGWRQTILEGLHDSAMAPGGTSYPVFGNFPVAIAGKTGTAETTLTDELGYQTEVDQSWYVALAPYDDPKIAIALTIENGGFGADSAAPAVCRMLQAYFKAKLDGGADPCAGPVATTTGTVGLD